MTFAKKPEPAVLIVDDNPFNRELLKGILKAQSLSVFEAKNGREALERIQAHPFRMIFMDLLMPGMDGFETIERIRRMGVETPIIIVSAMSDKQDRQRCLESGGDDFLPKPVDMARAKELIETYLHAEPSRRKPAGGASGGTDGGESQRRTDYHVLLVEEDDGRAGELVRVLKRRQFPVCRVSNGDQAWTLFTERPHRFDVIISNVFTSGIDGLGILARVKRDHPHVLVFIYAVERDPETFQLAVRLGADGVLTLDELSRSIGELIDSAIFQAARRGSRSQVAATARAVRQAQAHLIRYGCTTPCGDIDIAYSPLSDAGGDVACCRRLNRAGRCGVFLGDVAGHSVIASYISAFYLGILTSRWNRAQDPLALLKTFNAELSQSEYDQYHLCATALLWDRRRERLRIASAGNPGPLLVRRKSDGTLDVVEQSGGGLCLGLLPKDDLFIREEIAFPAGTYLFIFSDGVEPRQITEVLSEGEVALDGGPVKGLGNLIIDRILERWGQDDDMVLITLKAPDNPLPPGLHYSFPADYGGVDGACVWAGTHLTPETLPPGRDPVLVLLALREGLINAVMHGSAFERESAHVDLSLFFETWGVRIDISDPGPGFDLPDPPASISDINVLQTGGRGLSVMAGVADRITVFGGTVSLFFGDSTE